VLALLALAAPAAAEEPPGRACIDLRIGEERYYDCLNRLLRESVPARRLSAADAPWNATTAPAYAIGGFNQQATRQMLGSSFGRAVVPERPPAALPPPPLAQAGTARR